ncbi:MAG: hypothetical protein ABR915_13690 [Thermoguttaceae bacterium]|jgi:hypothetical protein
MSLWNKILLWVIGLVALPVFFYMAARTLKTYHYWGNQVSLLTTQLKAQQEKNFHLVNDDEPGNKGIRRLEADLNRLLTNRGRIWKDCEPQKVSLNGEVAVGTEQAGSPNHISDKMVLYVFEGSDDQQSGSYLGEFKVTEVAENKVGLAPTAALTPRELKRLTGSKGPWTLFELMPADRHFAFADLSEDEKKALFPSNVVSPKVVSEYLRDGQPSKADDPEKCRRDGKYVRRLRDYKELFRSYRTDRTLFVDICEALVRDKQYIDDAKTDAERQVQFVEQYVAVLRTEKAQAIKARQAAGGFRALLEQRLAGIQDKVAALIKDNLTKAAEINQLQVAAAQRIRTMEQTGARNR